MTLTLCAPHATAAALQLPGALLTVGVLSNLPGALLVVLVTEHTFLCAPCLLSVTVAVVCHRRSGRPIRLPAWWLCIPCVSPARHLGSMAPQQATTSCMAYSCVPAVL
eukprot:311957-Chlamydomonas_euryale.AAC.8